MGRKYFGTDGVRGRANTPPMTPDIILRLATATGQFFRQRNQKNLVVIGKDTRLSGYMVETALTSGFISAGMDVALVGPLPTPAISMLTKALRADLGVMISASHNPYYDNGIKIFGPDGYKLSDSQEEQIEALMDQISVSQSLGHAIGKAYRLNDAPGRYIEWVKRTLPEGTRFDGFKVVLDCANGASYKVAPCVLDELGANLTTIANHPDGYNINAECGATNLALLQKTVVERQADIGIALDGDGDRVMIVDEKGQVINGDQILALISTIWKDNNWLRGDGVVATVMSNLGLEQYLDSLGLNLYRTNVGDRYVTEYMRSHNLNVGGEQSGHVILSDHSSTGDGLIAALQFLYIFKKLEKPVSEFARVFDIVPQILHNISFQGPCPLDFPEVKTIITQSEKDLEGEGRLLVRKSGTEPIVRIMAESNNENLLNKVIHNISEAVENHS